VRRGKKRRPPIELCQNNGKVKREIQSEKSIFAISMKRKNCSVATHKTSFWKSSRRRKCSGAVALLGSSFLATICVPPMRLVMIKLLLIIIEFI
jgi:hypothetical protein